MKNLQGLDTVIGNDYPALLRGRRRQVSWSRLAMTRIWATAASAVRGAMVMAGSLNCSRTSRALTTRTRRLLRKVSMVAGRNRLALAGVGGSFHSSGTQVLVTQGLLRSFRPTPPAAKAGIAKATGLSLVTRGERLPSARRPETGRFVGWGAAPMIRRLRRSW